MDPLEILEAEAGQASVAERGGDRTDGILGQITFLSEDPKLKPYLGVGCPQTGLEEMVMLFTEGSLGEKQIWGRKLGSTSDAFAHLGLWNIQ